MAAMSPQECRAFLSSGGRTAKLATVRADGRPHVAPVWFLLDGDSVVFMTGRASVKGRTMLRDPRVAICVDDETYPYVMVIAEGTATWSEEPSELLDWGTRIAARYVGPEEAPAVGRRNSAKGSLLVRVAMENVVAYDHLAG